MVSITTLAEVKGRIAADLSDGNLQTLIDRVESRIMKATGHPSAQRSDRFVAFGGGGVPMSPPDYIYLDNYGPHRAAQALTDVLTLARDPASIAGIKTANTDAASADDLDPDLYYYSGANVYRRNYYWLTETIVTWTPVAFTDDFIEATIDLVRLRLGRSAYKGERVGNEWQYTARDSPEDAEREIIDRLTPANILA